MTNKRVPRNILVVRFSAIGDVAMTVPVLQSLAESYPQTHISLVTNQKFAPFFCNMPSNFFFIGIDMSDGCCGRSGYLRIKNAISEMSFDAVADLHGVHRSRMIKCIFMCHGVKIRSIHKQRLSRYALTRFHFKRRRQQLTSFEKYMRVFRALGFEFQLMLCPIIDREKSDIGIISSAIGCKDNKKWVGVAPFAAHKGKIYPLDRMEQVVAGIQQNDDVGKIFVFAYGKEREQIKEWEKYSKVIIMSGQLKMSEELVLISKLDVMLSMDSSNMHLASLTGTPVVSIWGATHPFAGFLGYGQRLEDCVQVDLPCRPCSVYGKRPCRYGDYHCLTQIAPEKILEHIGIYL